MKIKITVEFLNGSSDPLARDRQDVKHTYTNCLSTEYFVKFSLSTWKQKIREEFLENVYPKDRHRFSLVQMNIEYLPGQWGYTNNYGEPTEG